MVSNNPSQSTSYFLRRFGFLALLLVAVIDAVMTFLAVRDLLGNSSVLLVALGGLALAIFVNGQLILSREIILSQNINVKTFGIIPWAVAMIIDGGTNYIALSNAIDRTDPIKSLFVVLISIILVASPIAASLGMDWFMGHDEKKP